MASQVILTALILLISAGYGHVSSLGFSHQLSGQDLARRANQGDSLPRCIYCPAPPFRVLGKQKDTEGSVLLKIVIGADGSVTHVEVVRSLSPERDEQAMNAVKKWKFKAAQSPDGDPVETTTSVNIAFHR